MQAMAKAQLKNLSAIVTVEQLEVYAETFSTVVQKIIEWTVSVTRSSAYANLWWNKQVTEAV